LQVRTLKPNINVPDFSFDPTFDRALSEARKARNPVAGYVTASALLSEPPHILSSKLPDMISHPPTQWNRHDFISKLVMQQIANLELGENRARAVLKNENGRSDIMMAVQRPILGHEQHLLPPAGPELFATMLQAAALAKSASQPAGFNSVAVVELKYSNVSKHGQHWRHGLRVNRSTVHDLPSLSDAHFLIGILDPHKALPTAVDFTDLRALTHLTFLLSCSSVGFLADVTVAVSENGELTNAAYLQKKGFVAFKLAVRDHTVCLVDAFRQDRRFSLKRAMTACFTLGNPDEQHPEAPWS
jgi:hypothetical protein